MSYSDIDDEDLKDIDISDLSNEDENILKDRFMELREVDGVAITKESFTEMYEHWLEGLSQQELFEIINN